MQTTCDSIMLPNPVTLHPDVTLNEAFSILRKVGTRYLPVVDNKGIFLGSFSSMTLIKLLLPQSVSIKEVKNPFALSFMQTTIEELRERLEARGHETIREYILPDKLPVCKPTTSIMEALNTLYHNHYAVVADPGTKRFLGVVTINGVLDHISPNH